MDREWVNTAIAALTMLMMASATIPPTVMAWRKLLNWQAIPTTQVTASATRPMTRRLLSAAVVTFSVGALVWVALFAPASHPATLREMAFLAMCLANLIMALKD